MKEESIMKKIKMIMAVAAAIALVGCGSNPEPEIPGRAGRAVIFILALLCVAAGAVLWYFGFTYPLYVLPAIPAVILLVIFLAAGALAALLAADEIRYKLHQTSTKKDKEKGKNEQG